LDPGTDLVPNLGLDSDRSGFIGDGTTVFNIGSSRLTVHMRYDLGIVFILAVETHSEYDRRNKTRRKK